jgi:multiple sugar transport system substrate-binding protein
MDKNSFISEETMKTVKVFVVMAVMVITAVGSAWAGGAGQQRGSGDVTLRFSWWGANERNARMNQVIDLFEQQHPGIKVSREYTSWGDYWTKFTTQAAAGTQPEVSLHVMQSVQEYVNKGVLLPLDDYVKSGKINIADWSGAAVSPGVINGKQYAIVYALVAQGVLYNTKILQDAGVAQPSEDWNYDEFKQYCLDLKQKLPSNVFAIESAATSDHAVEIFMRSRGKSVYSADGRSLGFTKDDLIAWWAIWEDLRKAGAVPSAVLSAELYNAPYEQTLFGSNRAALIFQNGNLIPTFQNLTSGEVRIIREPRANKNIPGDFFQPTMFGISPKSQHVNEAVTFIDWMVNNVEANLIFKAEYGVPGDPDVSKALENIASDTEKKNYQYSARIFADATVPPSSARAEGSATIFDPMMRLIYEEVSTDAISIQQGVDRFFNEAGAQLAKNKANG